MSPASEKRVGERKKCGSNLKGGGGFEICLLGGGGREGERGGEKGEKGGEKKCNRGNEKAGLFSLGKHAFFATFGFQEENTTSGVGFLASADFSFTVEIPYRCYKGL